MILVTGAAGFIGYHVAKHLLAEGHCVHGLDNLNSYYDPSLKEARLRLLSEHPNFAFHRVELADGAAIASLFAAQRPAQVIHLAAQAGVRHSLSNPGLYIESNITGFLNILEGCRLQGAEHLVYASSSSVYGLNTSMPFSVGDRTDHPVSLYGATKKANEMMAHCYSHLFRIPTTGLRFFTVFGPWGRPDMSYFRFTKAILEGTPIDIYNNGQMKRDFTYIDDIVDGVVRAARSPATPNPTWSGAQPDTASSPAPFRLYNIGNHAPVALLDFIGVIESKLGRKAIKRLLPPQPGDVLETYAEIEDLTQAHGFRPKVQLETGVARFVEWYRSHYRV